MLQPKYEVTVEINEDEHTIRLLFATPISEDVKDDLYMEVVNPYYGFYFNSCKASVKPFVTQDKINTYDDIYIIYNRNYDVIEVVKEIVNVLKKHNITNLYLFRSIILSGDKLEKILRPGE